MAAIRNERDLILQTAAVRVIEVPPPDAVIIEGYTGITLTKDITAWVQNFSKHSDTDGLPAVTPDRAVLTAQLKGIPLNTEVTWTSNVPLTDTLDPLIKIIEAKNYPWIGFNFTVQTDVTVSVVYGGQTFSANIHMIVLTG